MLGPSLRMKEKNRAYSLGSGDTAQMQSLIRAFATSAITSRDLAYFFIYIIFHSN